MLLVEQARSDIIGLPRGQKSHRSSELIHVLATMHTHHEVKAELRPLQKRQFVL